MAQEKYKVTLSEVADQEVDEAFCWYQSRRFGLGWEFTAELEFFLFKLATNPFAYSFIGGSNREGRLERFPYQIVFEVADNTVTVFHVFHAHRNPNKKRS